MREHSTDSRVRARATRLWGVAAAEAGVGLGKTPSRRSEAIGEIVRSRVYIAVIAAFAVVFGSIVFTPTAATALSPGVSFSADDQSTWQTNGTIWGIGTARGKIVAGGTFSQVRPPAGGAGTPLTQNALVILNAETGAPDSCQFSMSLAGGTPTVRAVQANDDESVVYIAGNFSNVGGVNVARIAALDVASCRVLPFRAPLPSSTVTALATYDNVLYVGGTFNSVGSATRRAYAAFNATSGALLDWVADAVRTRTDLPASVLQGRAVEVSPDGSRIVVGGDMFEINGVYSHSLAIVSAATGANGAGGTVMKTYPAGFIPDTSVTKTVRDGGDGRFYIGNEGSGGGVFDGRAAFSWDTGDQVWRDNCLGATQALLVYAGTLYSASHAHDCNAINAYADGIRRYFLAQNPDTMEIYGWLPLGNDGIGEGIGPRAMVVATGATNGKKYLWYGGEFTRINGHEQQGLTRFGPDDVGAPPTPVVSAEGTSDGTVQVRFRTTVDPDDSVLTYRVYRGSSTTPVWTGTAKSLWWERPQVTFVDKNVTPGTTYSYRVTASDGTNTSSYSPTATATAVAATADYDAAVRALSPLAFWSGATSGGWVVDESARNDRSDGVNALLMDGASAAPADSAVPSNTGSFVFDGVNDYMMTDQLRQGPSVYTVSAWIKTTTNQGGKIVGFGNGRPNTGTGASNTSGNYDRHIYMLNDGRVRFGVWTGSASTLTSPSALNDGQWHYVAASQGAEGMRLYVDGRRVGSNGISGQQPYWGIWRVGGDSLNGWPDQPSSSFFAGSIDDVAIYPSVVSRTDVASLYVKGGGALVLTPTPADAYGQAVYQSNPDLYWRFNDSSGVAVDSSMFARSPGSYNTAAVRTTDGVVTGDGAVRLNGSQDASVATAQSLTPSGTMSAEVWFKTTTTSGGKIFGFENVPTGLGNNYDKHLYMTNAGRLVWGSWIGSAAIVTSPGSYNDGVWHQAVTTLDGSGRKLFVDGQLVAQSAVAGAETGDGYWRVGGGNIGGWPDQPSSSFIAADIDDFSVYADTLSPATIQSHYAAAVSDAPAPSTPGAVAATSDFSGVKVTWDASSARFGVTGYRVYRGATEDFAAGPDTLVGQTTDRQYVDTTAPAGDVFYRVIAAAPGDKASAASAPVHVSVADTTAPSVPSGLTAVAQGADVELAWNASTDNVGVTSYDIYRGAAPDFSTWFATKVGSSATTTFTDPSRPAGNAYYWVIARDAAGNSSGASDGATVVVPDTTAPSAPGTLQATVGGDPEIALTWAAASDDTGVTGYDVFRGTEAGFVADDSSRIGHVAGTSYTDAALTPGTWYYRVIALDAAGNAGAPSNEASGVIADTTPPTTPSGLSAQTSGADVQLLWDAAADDVAVDHYEIHRGDSVDFAPTAETLIGQTGDTSYTDPARPVGPAHYRVVAVDAAGNASAASATASANVPDVTAPSQVTATAVLSGHDATVSWDAASDDVGVATYRVFRGATADFVVDASSQIAETTETAHVDAALTAGTWYYRVVAFDDAGNAGPASAVVSVEVADTTAPTAPTALAVEVTGASLHATWTAATDDVAVTGYRVFRGATEDFVPDAQTLVGSTTTASFDEATPAPGTWYYRVVATDAAGNLSAPSASVAVTVAAPDTVAPTKPSEVAATAAGSTVTVTWHASTDDVGVHGYVVHRGSTADFVVGVDTAVGETTEPTFVDEGRPAGTWYYRVIALDAAGNASDPSDSASAVIADAAGPTVPTGLSATVDGDDVQLAWTASTDDVGVAGYDIYRGASEGFEVSASTKIGSSTTLAHTDTSVPAGTWFYRVVARDDAGNVSPASDTATVDIDDTTAPTKVDGVLAVASGSSVALTWNAASDDLAVAGYHVYRAASAEFAPDASNRIGESATTAFTDTAPAGTWFYKVLAVDAAGNAGEPSDAATAVVVDSVAPSVPSGVGASVSGSSVGLSWSASTDDVGVTGYRVFRGDSAGFEASAGAKVADVSGTSFTDEGRPVGTWYYRVAAVDAAGNVSAASDAVAATVVGVSTPVTVSLNVVEDALVVGVLPSQNNGALNQLSSRGGSSPLESFLSFDLPAAPAGTVLTGAELRVRTSTDSTASSADTHAIHLVSGSWSEMGVTWSNRPTGVGALLGTLGATPAINTPYTASLSADALAGSLGTTQTLRLSSTGSDNVRVWSSESTNASYRPVLVLTFTPTP